MQRTKHIDAFTKKHLKTGEAVVSWCTGYIGEMMGTGGDAQKNGTLIVTGERVVFYRKGFLGEVIEAMPLKSITSIERKSCLGYRTVQLHTSHDAMEFKTFDKVAEEAICDAIEKGRDASSSNHSSTNSDPAELLKKLAELKTSGILSEEEYWAKKVELLAKM